MTQQSVLVLDQNASWEEEGGTWKSSREPLAPIRDDKEKGDSSFSWLVTRVVPLAGREKGGHRETCPEGGPRERGTWHCPKLLSG